MAALDLNRGQALIRVGQNFDEAIAKEDLGVLVALLADDVCLHRDCLTLFNDLSGIDKVTNYFRAYFGEPRTAVKRSRQTWL